MALLQPKTETRQEDEWQELQAVLSSGILDKAPNLRHFLEYVAEQYFAGNTDQVKEYSIAVQALHRLEQFDPQSDTIVRVTAYTLRKKLQQYYATEGADHPIQIEMPVGKYVLRFRSKDKVDITSAEIENRPADLMRPAAKELGTLLRSKKIWTSTPVAAAVVLMLLGSFLLKKNITNVAIGMRSSVPAAQNRGAIRAIRTDEILKDKVIRVAFGTVTHPYVDVVGQTWLTDRYCEGGSAFSHPGHEIQGTDDPTLFLQGREGKFRCKIPVLPGIYQLQLLFADTAGDKEAARQVDFSINDIANAALDVVDESGGNDIVVGKVYTGIRPMSDGTIHLDFTSDGSFVNAIELTRTETGDEAPIRMLAGPLSVRDDSGNTWLPERFFQGGRRSFHADNLPKVATPRMFEWERYGRFHYLIPVVAGRDYRVRLYFSEGWFGSSNGGPGGLGSRIFNVSCNGTNLLNNFDILRGHKGSVVVITADRVKPTAHGMLELYFTPVKNYPLINAIEIDPAH